MTAAALHKGALSALELLAQCDHEPGTAQGKAMIELATAVEAYERATLPPPFGDAKPAPACVRRVEWGGCNCTSEPQRATCMYRSKP